MLADGSVAPYKGIAVPVVGAFLSTGILTKAMLQKAYKNNSNMEDWLNYLTGAKRYAGKYSHKVTLNSVTNTFTLVGPTVAQPQLANYELYRQLVAMANKTKEEMRPRP